MDIIAKLEAEHIASLGHKIPDFKAGDTLRVGYKVTEGTRSRVQNYAINGSINSKFSNDKICTASCR